jgi:hypothetical protein
MAPSDQHTRPSHGVARLDPAGHHVDLVVREMVPGTVGLAGFLPNAILGTGAKGEP